MLEESSEVSLEMGQNIGRWTHKHSFRDRDTLSSIECHQNETHHIYAHDIQAAAKQRERERDTAQQEKQLRQQSTARLQRVVRGRAARRRVNAKKARDASAILRVQQLQRCARCFLARKRCAQRRQTLVGDRSALLKSDAATALQRQTRARRARVVVRRVRAAGTLQRWARHSRATARAALDQLAREAAARDDARRAAQDAEEQAVLTASRGAAAQAHSPASTFFLLFMFQWT